MLSSSPTTFDSAKKLAQQLIDHRASHGTVVATPDQEKGGNNKRKFWNNKKSQPAQDSAKKQQMVVVHGATTLTAPSPLRQYAGTLPKCNKCNFHYTGPCQEIHCRNCNKKGYTTRFCKAPAQQATAAAKVGASRACYGGGKTRHIKRDCPKEKNANSSGVG